MWCSSPGPAPQAEDVGGQKLAVADGRFHLVSHRAFRGLILGGLVHHPGRIRVHIFRTRPGRQENGSAGGVSDTPSFSASRNMNNE